MLGLLCCPRCFPGAGRTGHPRALMSEVWLRRLHCGEGEDGVDGGFEGAGVVLDLREEEPAL
jgi:hypothetical protein